MQQTTLVEYLKTLHCGVDEFYKDVRAAQNEQTDHYISMFIDCLLASTDYESFYKVMAREGAKSAARRAAHNIDADAKAEAKTSSRPSPGKYQSGSKYSDNDSDKKSSYK